MTLERDLRHTLESLGVRETRLLVAVSGGRDSMVLLDLLRRAGRMQRLELVVAHVHHGLRGSEADDDEAHVRAAARAAGLAFRSCAVDPEAARRGGSSRGRPTLEEAARLERRAALASMATDADCAAIVTAHHAGDQAETVLLRLLRGTGPDGLAAMSERSEDGRWLRPLLGVMPERIEAWAARHAIASRVDSSNQDRRFTRNRLRHDWIPGLSETFNPQLLRALCDLAEAQRRDREWIDGLVAQAARERIEIGPRGIHFVIDGWDELPDALARRLVRTALVAAGLGRDITRRHLERVLDFLRLGRRAGRDRRIELPKGVVLRRLQDRFVCVVDSGQNEMPSHDNARVQRRL